MPTKTKPKHIFDVKVNFIFNSFNHCIFFFLGTILLQEKRPGFLAVNCSFINGNPLGVGIECKQSIRKVRLSEMPEQF